MKPQNSDSHKCDCPFHRPQKKLAHFHQSQTNGIFSFQNYQKINFCCLNQFMVLSYSSTEMRPNCSALIIHMDGEPVGCQLGSTIWYDWSEFSAAAANWNNCCMMINDTLLNFDLQILTSRKPHIVDNKETPSPLCSSKIFLYFIPPWPLVPPLRPNLDLANFLFSKFIDTFQNFFQFA